MAKRKDKDAAKKGFQIPIENGDEVARASSAAVANKEAHAAKTAQGAQSTQEAQAGQAESTHNEATDSNDTKDYASDSNSTCTNEEVDAHESASENGTAHIESSTDADQLVEEAEAIIEEASAAEQLEAAQASAQDWQDRYMRLHAEWDTYRRRTGEQRAEEKQRATEKLMENLLPVLDDFERSVAYAEENGENGLLEGVKAVQTKLIGVLTASGLEIIDPAGQAYEALEAQAVQMIPDEESFDETVKDVFQKGYKMGKKVLRPAMVTVTTGGPKRPKEEPEEEQ